VRRVSNLRPGVLILALAIAIFLWGVAHGTSKIDTAFDIPVELHHLADGLVVTDQNVDEVNVRVQGSRAALRNVSSEKLKFVIDVSGGKPGVAVYDVDVDRIELPRGASFVSHSPSRVQVRFEKRGRKAVTVEVEIEGEPATGFHLVGFEVEPARVWLAGARSQVMRLDSVVTETINITGIREDEEREVRLRLSGGTVWMEDKKPVTVTVRLEADLPPELELPLEGEAEAAPGAEGGA